LFEHWLNLKPWDLERMTVRQVQFRLWWIKQEKKRREQEPEVDLDV
jgi:hypothetical protein